MWSFKRQVDNWLSSSINIPAKAILVIQRLMNGEAESSPRIVIDFTDEEWDIICEAAKAHKETFLQIRQYRYSKCRQRKRGSPQEVYPGKNITTPPSRKPDESSATLQPATWRMETPFRRTSDYTVNWKKGNTCCA